MTSQRIVTSERFATPVLTCLRIINEPTAAATACRTSDWGGKDETIVVYDLGGGGTFDRSLDPRSS